MVSWPALSVEIAFAGNPNDASPTWTDVTSYVQGFTTKRGRQTELDVFQPGICEVKLDNQDRRFDPSHAGGPYYPNVTIGKRMRISATYSSTTYRIFDGIIDAWPQTWQARVAASVPMTATDAFKRFQQFPLNGDYPATILSTTPWVYWQFPGTIADSSGNANTTAWTGSSPASYGGFTGSTVLNTSKYFGADDYVATTATGWSSAGFSLEVWWYPTWNGNDGVWHGLYQTHAPTWSNPTSGVTIFKYLDNNIYFRIVSPAGSIQDLTYAVNATTMPANVFTHWVFTAGASEGMCIYRNGALVAGPSAAISMPSISPPAPRVGQGHDAFATSYLAQVAIYGTTLAADQVYDHYKARLCYGPQETSAQRITRALDVLGWPAGRRDLDGGAAILAETVMNEQMLAHLQKVNNSEVGRLFMGGNGDVRFIGRDAAVQAPYTTVQATFGDDATGAELPYNDLILSYDDAQTWNEVRLQRVGGRVQVARDATLQTTDIVRTFSDTSLLHSADSQTLAAAQYRLEQYKTPRLRIEQLGIQGARDPVNLWPQALGRDIGDRVTVVRRPQHVGTAISEQCIIEGVAHDFDVTSTWTTTYNLSRADITSYWLLGVTGRGELNTNTRLSF